MDGTIVNFRGGKHTQYSNQMIVQVSTVNSKDKAKALLGKKVVWTSSADKKIEGKVAKEHGTKGALKVIFERGMPGQSVGQKVAIE